MTKFLDESPSSLTLSDIKMEALLLVMPNQIGSAIKKKVVDD
jgi:hypothetical protein